MDDCWGSVSVRLERGGYETVLSSTGPPLSVRFVGYSRPRRDGIERTTETR